MASTAIRLLALCLFATACIDAATHPCGKGNHQELDHPDRSIKHVIKSGVNERNDVNLAKGWYRFVSGAGGEIPTSPPKTGECNSQIPIWINGSQPANDGQIHTLSMCYFLNKFATCGVQLQINAKRCVEGIVYELLPTSSSNSTQVITSASYCAGTEEPCPVGQSSKTGFTPNCYVAPTVSVPPQITLKPSPDTFEFHCELGNLEPRAMYKVTWKLDNKEIHMEELQLGNNISVLTENLLALPRQTVLGKNLTCAASGRYIGEPQDHWGKAMDSAPFFVGIEVSDASGKPLRLQSFVLTLAESEDHQLIDIRSTIPIRCDPRTTQLTGKPCKIVIAIRNDNSMDKKPLRCRNGMVEQLKLATCSVTLTPNNWNIGETVSIRATKDFKYDGQKARVIEFNMTEGPGRSIWDGYVPHPIQVVTEDFIDKRAQCSSVNDPHMTTFDGHRWNNYYEGEFVLYRHTELPFEARAFYKRCRPRSSVTCNCAVAARAGDDVIIIDRCNSMGDLKIWGSDKKVEYNLLRTRTISIDDVISPNFRIYAINGGREYHIYYPHGAVLKAQLTGGGYDQFMNLWLSPSPADFNRTTGMCGTFNGDKTEDLRMRNGSIYNGKGAGHNQQPKEFSKHWRVDPTESIYNGQVPALSQTYKKQYCSCVKTATSSSADEYLDCEMNSDAQRCDQRGEDITNKNFEYSSGASKKAKPFVFDPDFEPPMPSWPTPSGWTKANATTFCEDFMTKSKAFMECNDTLSMDHDIDMCVEDIKLSDGIEFAMAALEAYKERCLNELSKYPDVPVPGDAFCLNECNNNGICKDGECICYRDYAGEDCSLQKSGIPNVFFTPFCDVATEKCESANVFGKGFINSNDLTCTFQPAEISEGKLNIFGEEEVVQGSYETFAEVRCPLSHSRAKRALAGQLAGQKAVTISNGKTAKPSNVIIYTQYNSICQTCDTSTGECPVKAGMCLIEGRCYKEGDKSPQITDGEQPFCDPAHSQSSWKFPAKPVTQPTPTAGLPSWAIGVIASAATLVLVTSGVVLYMKVIRKREKVVV